MMRWARTAVDVVVEPEEFDAGAFALLAASSCRRWPTPSAGSTEMPIMKPPPSASAPLPPTLNMALSLPGPMAPRKRKFGVGLAAASRVVVR